VTDPSTEAWGTFKVNIRVLQGQCGADVRGAAMKYFTCFGGLGSGLTGRKLGFSIEKGSGAPFRHPTLDIGTPEGAGTFAY